MQLGHGRLSHQDGVAVMASLYSSRCNLLVEVLSMGIFSLYNGKVLVVQKMQGLKVFGC